MKRLTSIIIIVLFFFPAFLKAQDEKIDTSMIRKIREEGLKHPQVRQIAHYITDVSGSRLTNSPGYHRAADWIVKSLKQWGLSSAQLEPWGEFGYGWEVQKLYVAMKTPYYTPIIAYSKPWGGSTNGLINSEVFMIEQMDSAYIAAHSTQIKGHIVMSKTADTVLHGTFNADGSRYSDSALSTLGDAHMVTAAMLKMYLPQIAHNMQIRDMLKNAGAVAIVEMSREKTDGTVFVDGFGGYRKKDQPAIPQIIMEKEDYLKMERLVESGHPVSLEIEVRAKLYGDDLQGHTVVGDIPGTDPLLKSEIVMIGGHLDSWQSATGATDNGAGCIVMMEAIRILKTLGVQPKRTIRISLWDGEEQGLLGSFHYVKNHFGDPADMKLKPEQAKISAYYNLDNGTGKIRGIYAQGNDAVVPIFAKWLEPFHDMGAATITMHNTGSTDHLSFDAVGIPAFQFIQDPVDYESRTHHSNMDTYDHLLPDDLEQAAIIVASFVYNTAMRPEKLPRKPLPKAEKFIFDGLF